MSWYDAGVIYCKIQNKYGGILGMMKAQLEGRLNPDDYSDYMKASSVLGLS